jgi:hypothetical protein
MGLVPTLLSLIGMAWGQDVVLLTGQDSPNSARFHAELALSLNNVERQAAQPNFTTLPMASQLDQVRPMLADSTGAAVVWLDESDAERLWVSVAFVAADRAVIRMIDLPRSEDPTRRSPSRWHARRTRGGRGAGVASFRNRWRSTRGDGAKPATDRPSTRRAMAMAHRWCPTRLDYAQLEYPASTKDVRRRNPSMGRGHDDWFTPLGGADSG